MPGVCAPQSPHSPGSADCFFDPTVVYNEELESESDEDAWTTQVIWTAGLGKKKEGGGSIEMGKGKHTCFGENRRKNAGIQIANRKHRSELPIAACADMKIEIWMNAKAKKANLGQKLHCSRLSVGCTQTYQQRKTLSVSNVSGLNVSRINTIRITYTY